MRRLNGDTFAGGETKDLEEAVDLFIRVDRPDSQVITECSRFSDRKYTNRRDRSRLISFDATRPPSWRSMLARDFPLSSKPLVQSELRVHCSQGH